MKRLAPVVCCALLLVAVAVTENARAMADAPVSILPHRPSTSPQGPKDPNKLTPANFHSPKLRGWINDVPDTGQFLEDSVVIMRVADRVTTAGGFTREWYSSYPEFRPAPDSAGRVTFLNSLMNRDVLGLTALSLNRPLAFEDRLTLREQRQRSLTGAVYRRFVADSVTVPESEVRSLWEAQGYLQHLRHIMVADRFAAERVRRELVSGQITWAAAVKKYSLAKSDNSTDGDLGWIAPDKLDNNIMYHVYGLRPGESSLPVQDREGWHIVQSVERKKVAAPAYEAMRNTLRDLIRAVFETKRSEKLMVMLRMQNGVVYDTAAATFAASKFFETTTVKQENMGATVNIDGSAPEFSPADTSRLIARWNSGGRFSIGDLAHAFSDIPPVMRPALTRMELVIAFTESIALEPAIAAYGAQLGLEKDPLVDGPMRRKLEELMVEHMYQDSIGSRTWVSKDERKAYYQANLSKFFTFPSVDYVAIFRPSKAGADSVEAMLKAGRKPLDIIRADSLGGLISGAIQHRRQDENGPYHKALFEEMRPGDTQVRGPDKAGDYIVLQVLKYDGGRQLSYDESEQMIDESMQNMKADDALKAMVARLKTRYKISAHPEMVMQIRLVDPTVN